MKVAIDSARLTHSHADAINGAVLQCRAVWQALHADHQKGINIDTFIADLKETLHSEEAAKLTHLHTVTGEKERHALSHSPYHSQLAKTRSLLSKGSPPIGADIADTLGHGVSAKEAVSAAIYAFLHAVQYSLSFHELMDYAISIGGDTDTIASMAGAIAGAYFGVEAIPFQFKDAAESVNEAISLSNSLYDLVTACPTNL
jgi:poly(ADP-ribose) glycohydrolase ARH3